MGTAYNYNAMVWTVMQFTSQKGLLMINHQIYHEMDIVQLQINDGKYISTWF